MTRLDGAADASSSASSGGDDDSADADAAALRRACFLRLAVRDALRALHAAAAAPPPYGKPAQLSAAAAAAAGCAIVFFGGSWSDAGLSGVLGAAIALLGWLADSRLVGSRLGFRRAFEFCAAAVVALATRALACTGLRVCRAAVTLSALQWLLQGWDFTEALVELAMRNALPGAAHLFAAVTVTALLGFGLDIGHAIADVSWRCDAPPNDQTCALAVSPRWWYACFPPTALALSVLLNAPPRRLPHTVAVATATYGFSLALTNNAAMDRMNTFLSAALAGALSNAWANARGKPAMASATAAVFVLVPDSMAALDSVHSLFGGGGDVVVGVNLTAAVLRACVAIGAGLFCGSLLVPPRELSATAVARVAKGGRGSRVVAWLTRRRRVPGRSGREQQQPRGEATYRRARTTPLLF